MLVAVNVLVCSVFVHVFVLVTVNRWSMCSMLFVLLVEVSLFSYINRSLILPLGEIFCESCIVERVLLCHECFLSICVCVSALSRVSARVYRDNFKMELQ